MERGLVIQMRWSIGLLAALAFTNEVSAQQAQPDAQVIAQAYDRCMATYAVRLTKTDASDEAIYAQATEGCRSLNDQLTSAINAQHSPAQASQILQSMEAQAKPGFMGMLAQIRSDRAQRSGS